MRAALNTLVLCTIFYGGWFALSYFESRGSNPPLWRGQYRTFVPGDLLLWAAVGTSMVLVADNQLARAGWLPWAGVGLGLVVGLALFSLQFTAAEKAGPDAMWIWASPTRVWHQLFTWWAGIALVAMFVVPVVLALINGQLRSTSAIAVAVLMAAWLSCMVYDGLRPPDPVPGKPVHAPLKVEYRTPPVTRLVSAVYPY